MKRIILTTLLLIGVGGIFYPDFTHASNNGLSYIVEPIFPSNQDEDIENYISITPESNSLKQKLEYLVTNKTNKKQELNIKLFNAYTSGNGGIQYKDHKTENNFIIDQKYEMKQYLEAPEKVVLEGGESKIVEIKVDIPDMDGTILGAIAFEGSGEKEQSENEGISFEIKNEINTIYGIAINFPTEQNHEFKFGKPFLDSMPSYYAVRLPISLESPFLLNDVDIEYEVEFKGENIFFSKENINFAPMTKTNYTIPFDYEEIVKNEPYTLKGTLTFYEGDGVKQIEEFEFTFSYDEKDYDKNIDKVKSLTAPIEKAEFSPYWLFLLLIIPLIIYYIRKKRKKAENEEENEQIIT